MADVWIIGKRTIGVVTKLDLMDAGTNALDVLTGRAFPLKLGFVGMVNRSQQDILTNKPMADALQAETEFFRQHPAYRNISNRCGTKFLSKQLNHVCIDVETSETCLIVFIIDLVYSHQGEVARVTDQVELPC